MAKTQQLSCSWISINSSLTVLFQLSHMNRQKKKSDLSLQIHSGHKQQRAITHSKICADHNSHDDAINGHSFTENDADQVLGFDTRGLDTTTSNANSGRVNPPEKLSHITSLT